MTYIDSSVALAYLFAEARAPSAQFLELRLISSRLLEYEVWTRVHARRPGEAVERSAHTLLAGVEMIEMNAGALGRALEPWPVALRTLDAVHLATALFLLDQGETVELASYDTRMTAAARAIGIGLAPL
ncbi:MAG TPA: PIN domain-containing protein [Stellaceae bacterium]|nr:PIN domain-containing protein [Stellaceae bacterium]